MRLLTLLASLLLAAALVAGWTKEDYEIFDLVSELEAAEGKGTNFYSWLGLDPSASKSELTKAYRRLSLELHPDKNPGGKDLQSRFARLGTINEILRSPEKRERYNFFYKNGVPKWRGTGYYYARYRPTLSHTLGFLVFLTSIFHLLVLRLNYTRDRKRVDYFERSAQTLGRNSGGRREKFLNPLEGDEEIYGRRLKVAMVEGNEMAGSLDLVIYNEQVYIPHDDGYLEPLSDLAISPSYFHTWPFKLSCRGLIYLVELLPPSTQASLPAFFRPHHAAHPGKHDVAPVKGFEVVAPKPNGTLRKSQSSRNGTETPMTATSTDSDGDEDDVADVNGNDTGVNGEGKKKKRGPGKASGMRRRKMGMKR